MDLKRRQFLKGAAGTAVLGFMPSVFARAAAAAAIPDRYLVIVQLYGGNDGLNTLVPANTLGAVRRKWNILQ